MPGSQDFAADPRNEKALIYLNGDLVTRADAKVSIFDAGFVLGDGIWEGLRLHKGRLAFLDAHLDRLFEGARKIELDIGLSRAEIKAALARTLEANQMTDGVHVRVMITRGLKKAVNQDPRNAIGKPTIVIVAEHKLPSPDIVTRGLALHTSNIRCTPAHMFDMRLNSHSRLNLIIALLDAIKVGADEALMLDPQGHVSSCNATNFFCVRDGQVWTSTGEFCFNGITRDNVIALCRANHIPLRIENFNLDHAHHAQEAFVTGTFGGVTPVRSIDGRTLPAALPGPITLRLRELYAALKDKEARMTGAVRIAMWSGPRNISTAMMRSFENRADTAVIDEPFYAAYLAKTGLNHPMRDEVIASQPTDWREVANALLGAIPDGRAIYYQKHMTHHMLPGFGRDWARHCRNAFLIRRPEDVLASYANVRDEASLEAIGLPQQRELFAEASDWLGRPPPVIDTHDVLSNPRAMTTALCKALDIPFTDQMLSWPAGHRTSDGVWAPAWYASVERSTCFAAAHPPVRFEDLRDDLKPIAEKARPIYDELVRHKLRA